MYKYKLPGKRLKSNNMLIGELNSNLKENIPLLNWLKADNNG